jgi:hypothetical protein
MPEIEVDIHQFGDRYDVAITRLRQGQPFWAGRCSQWGPVTRSSLVRAQRLQLKIYDQMQEAASDTHSDLP